MKNGNISKGIVTKYKIGVTPDRAVRTRRKAASECILFCKRLTPNVFDIKDGFAVVNGVEDCRDDGICMIANFTKVVFVFDQADKNKMTHGNGGLRL